MARLSRPFWLLFGASVASGPADRLCRTVILLQAFHLTHGNVSVLGVNAALVLLPSVVAAAPFAGVLAHCPGARDACPRS